MQFFMKSSKYIHILVCIFLVQYSQSYYYITVKLVSESVCIRTFLSWTKMAITQSILKLGHPGGWGQVEEDNDDEDNNDEYDDNYKADNNNNNIFFAEWREAKDAERSEANLCRAASFAKPR